MPDKNENTSMKIFEREAQGSPPPNLYVYTSKYGETASLLKEGFGEGAAKIENMYEVTPPEGVLDVCREVRSLGGVALLVGGCVRDVVISKELGVDLTPKDFDLEVYGLSPQTLNHLLELKFGPVGVEGKAYQVFKVKIEDSPKPLDTSIPRRDSKVSDGHKGFLAEGDPAMEIREAALRRDLTFNSMAFNPLTETLYDPYEGVSHIKQKVIEVTDMETFKEDPLRVLRVAQFASRFSFSVSERTKTLCGEMVRGGELDGLSKERVTEEVEKLFVKGKKPSIGLSFMREVGFIERYWPEVLALYDVPQEERWHPEGDVWRHTLQVVDAAAKIAEREALSDEARLVLMLSTLCHDFGKPSTTEFKDGAYRAHGHEEAGVLPSENFLSNFTFPQDAKRKVLALVPDHLKPIDFYSKEVGEGLSMDRALKRLSVRLSRGETNLYMLSLLVEADQRGRNGKGEEPLEVTQVANLEEWRRWLTQKLESLGVSESAPVGFLMGRDLIGFNGFGTGGPHFKPVLGAVYLDQLDGMVGSRETALRAAERYFNEFLPLVQDRVAQAGVKEVDVWEALGRLEDPRVGLPAS